MAKAEPGRPVGERWLEVARTQHDVLRRSQLLALGCSRRSIDAHVAARRWQQPASDVIVLHNGPLTVRQRWWVAALAVGPLAGRTALSAHGLTGWPSQSTEVVVRRGAQRVVVRGLTLKVHESRRHSSEDVVLWESLAMHSVERAAVDAAAWTKEPRAACGLLVAVVQQRMSNAARLRSALLKAGRIRHVRLLRAVLNDIEGGAQAMTEVDLSGVCKRYGLLPPERQVVRVDPSGKRRYVDAKVTASNGRSVLVEVDGALHLLVKTYWEDMSRGNELVIAGERVLRFPSIALLIDEAAVGNQLRRACGLEPFDTGAVAA